MSQPENRIGSEAPDYGAPQVQDVPVEQEPARIGPVGRLTGVLFSPGETFADINRKPTWLVPIIIAIVLGIAGTLVFNWRVNPNWDRIIRNQIRRQVEGSGRPMPSEEQMQQQISLGKTMAKLSPVFVIVGVPIVYLILAGVFALGLMVMGVQTTFKKILSVVAWSNVGIGLVALIVTTASLMVQDREKLDQIDPTRDTSFAPTNLGAFLSSGTSGFIKSIATSVDIFTIWLLILMIIGFAVIGGSKKVTTGKTGTLVFSLWIVWVLIKAGIAVITGN